MSNNTVSTIIPTKNNGDILEKCLSSIEGLEYPTVKWKRSSWTGIRLITRLR